VQKSNFAKPLVEDLFIEAIDAEAFAYIGDYEYAILKKTRVELISAIKDGRPLSNVLGILDNDLKQLSEVSLERFARTKHTEVMNNARREYFDSTDVVTGYQYSAILDDRTSEICSGLHGKFFTEADAPTPPMHFNCRSTLIPITKYEKFTPTESIRGMSPNDFIDENKGEGFAKYSVKEQSEQLEKTEIRLPEITDKGVELVVEYSDKQDTTTYSLNKKEFQKTIVTYEDDKKEKILSVKHERLDDASKV
jgi:SPP1 gp7 family putative phage head morphogenesis protein